MSYGVEKIERLVRVSCLRQLCYHARSRLLTPDTKSCLGEHSARCREPHGSRPSLGAQSTSPLRRRRSVGDHSHLSRVPPKTRKELLAVMAVELHARARDQRSPGPSSLSRGRCVTARNCFVTLYMARADRMDGPRAKVVARASRTPYPRRKGIVDQSQLMPPARRPRRATSVERGVTEGGVTG